MLYVLLLMLPLLQMPSKAQVDKFRKEAVGIQEGINGAVQSAGSFLSQSANGFYLEGCGAVFTLEVTLEPTRNPFSSQKTPNEVRTIVTQRRKDVKDKLVELVKQRAGGLESLAPTDSMTIILNVLNSNPADLPDLPSQLIITVKKQDALDFRDKKIDAADFVTNKITVREF